MALSPEARPRPFLLIIAPLSAYYNVSILTRTNLAFTNKINGGIFRRKSRFCQDRFVRRVSKASSKRRANLRGHGAVTRHQPIR
jgi:hypothetical protein